MQRQPMPLDPAEAQAELAADYILAAFAVRLNVLLDHNVHFFLCSGVTLTISAYSLLSSLLDLNWQADFVDISRPNAVIALGQKLYSWLSISHLITFTAICDTPADPYWLLNAFCNYWLLSALFVVSQIAIT